MSDVCCEFSFPTKLGATLVGSLCPEDCCATMEQSLTTYLDCYTKVHFHSTLVFWAPNFKVRSMPSMFGQVIRNCPIDKDAAGLKI